MHEFRTRALMLKEQINGMIEELNFLEKTRCPDCGRGDVSAEAWSTMEPVGQRLREYKDGSFFFDPCPTCLGSGFLTGYKPPYADRQKLD